MASSINILLSPPKSQFSFCSRNSLLFYPSIITFRRTLPSKSLSISASASTRALEALIFDCDGVILESEHLHRQAYNDAFSLFNVRCPSSDDDGPLNWSLEFYDVLQNQVGGGKPKMRWYFKEHGWPTSTIFQNPPEVDSDRAKLIDTLQDWKTERYKEIIKSGTVKPRPGVLRLMDEAKAAVRYLPYLTLQFLLCCVMLKRVRLNPLGLPGSVPGINAFCIVFQGKMLAVCSAATKSSVVLSLENLIGLDRFHGLDCFLAGDDVKEKKPDPSIYITAAKKLGVSENNCLVVEDSVIGLQAATGAGMSCVITYTSSTADQDFKEAIAIYPDLSDVRFNDLESLLQDVVVAK